MARPDRLLRELIRHRFVVTLKAGAGTFDGLLDDHDAATLDFIDAHVITDGGEKVPVDGHLYLPRAEIAYMQRPDAQ